jgi:hypothetical protein
MIAPYHTHIFEDQMDFTSSIFPHLSLPFFLFLFRTCALVPLRQVGTVAEAPGLSASASPGLTSGTCSSVWKMRGTPAAHTCSIKASSNNTGRPDMPNNAFLRDKKWMRLTKSLTSLTDRDQPLPIAPPLETRTTNSTSLKGQDRPATLDGTVSSSVLS